MIKKYFSYFLGIPKSIVFNFYYFDFLTAIKFPVFISKNVKISKLGGTVKINSTKTGGVKIGFGDVGIFDISKRRTIWDVQGEVVINGKAFIGHGSKIVVCDGAKLIINNKFRASAELAIVCTEYIEFGIQNLISWDVLIMDSDFHAVVDSISGEVGNTREPIIFGDHVWIGCRVSVFKGVRIANDCIVAAGTTLYKSVEQSNTISSSSTQKIIKTNVNWIG